MTVSNYNIYSSEGCTGVWVSSCVWDAWQQVASSPGLSELFSLAGKNERGPRIQSHMTNIGEDGVALGSSQSSNFKSIWHFWSIKRSSARPLRIVLLITVAFLLTRIEPKCLKIALTHVQFTWSATLPTLVYGPMSHTWLWTPGSPSRSRVRWKDRGAWGWG